MAEAPRVQLQLFVTGLGGLLASSLATVGFAAMGCAHVDPGGDFNRAGESIAERTGVSEVFSPETEALIGERVEELLEDGLAIGEAVEIALLNNPGFQSLFEEIGISRAEVVQSGLLSNPVISGLVKFPEGGGRASIDLGVSQQLVDLWQIPVRRKIAKARLERTIAAVVHQAVNLAADTKSNYHRLRVRQMEVDNISSNLKLVKDATGVVERQVAHGAASQLDQNLAQAALLDVRMELIAAERLLETARVELGRTLGLSPARYPSQLTSDLPLTERLPGIDELIDHARGQRFDLRRAEQELTAAEDEVIQQSLLVLPSVMAGIGAERPEYQSLPGRNFAADTLRSSIRNGALTAPDVQTRSERAAQRRQIIDFLIGPSFQVTVPLFDQNQAKIATAASRVRQRRKDLDELMIRAESEIATSVAALKAASSLVEFYQREAIPLAEANEKASLAVFSAGAQSVLVLLEAQRSLVARSRAHIVARGEYALARVELERAVGGRLPTEGIMSGSVEVQP